MLNKAYVQDKNLNAMIQGSAENLQAWYNMVHIVPYRCVPITSIFVPTYYDMKYIFSLASMYCNYLIFLKSFALD